MQTQRTCELAIEVEVELAIEVKVELAIEVEVEDIDPNGKISLRPLLDSGKDEIPEEKMLDESEEDESIEIDGDDSSEDDDYNQKETDSKLNDRENKAKASASFEDAFQAELEAVHGDLGKSSSRRSGNRKRR